MHLNRKRGGERKKVRIGRMPESPTGEVSLKAVQLSPASQRRESIETQTTNISGQFYKNRAGEAHMKSPDLYVQALMLSNFM